MSFPLYLDENVNPLVAKLLANLGYDVLPCLDAGLSQQAITDEAQFEFATSHGRALVTHDQDDFGLIVEAWYFSGRAHAGVIVTPILRPRAVANRLHALAAVYPDGVGNLFLYA